MKGKNGSMDGGTDNKGSPAAPRRRDKEHTKQELVDAAVWYETKETGLGVRFREEISRVIARIGEDPTLWRMREGGYRRDNCPVFPYFVAYIIREERVVVVAVAHSHRRPEYFAGRGPE